jgi:hypothetical protein
MISLILFLANVRPMVDLTTIQVTRKEYQSTMAQQNLFIGSLAYSTTDDSLKAHFEQIGEVASARVITDRDSGRSKGFGFGLARPKEDRPRRDFNGGGSTGGNSRGGNGGGSFRQRSW